MSFSSLRDPIDIARAHAALEAVWLEVKETIPDADHKMQRNRIASLIIGCAPLALDEDDLKQNVLLQFRQKFVA